ncbi:hypothetical protein R1flu_020703 [Riccia fluitans]|uniref:Uncharacterized protein n=1 Tax=Riccia fluitans TaxID=41844 RepID=A0ABD1ZM88_9MARC
MGFGAGDIVGMIWSHPVASVVVALLFTPPLFPIVVFFSPLLISTALVVLAMISMGSSGDDSGSSGGNGAGGGCYNKRDCNELREEMEYQQQQHHRASHSVMDDEDGPYLNDFDDRRQHKRRKGGAAAVSDDNGWLEKVKGWEETGRAWVDSVLHHEVRNKAPSNITFSSFPSVVGTSREVKFAQPVTQAAFVPPSAGSPPSDANGNAPPPLERDERITGGKDTVDRPAQNAPSADEGVTNLGGKGSNIVSKGDEKLAAGKALFDPVEGNSKASREESVVSSAHETRGDYISGWTDGKGAQYHQEPPSTSNRSGDGRSAQSGGEEHRSKTEKVEHHRTPSVVAVTLSEKLNVPLEDIMSLLKGDDKPSGGAAPPAGRSSSWTSSGKDHGADKAGEQNDRTSSEKTRER